MVDEFAVLAEEAVSTSPVLREVFLDEWQSAFSGLLICYGSLLEGDFGGDRECTAVSFCHGGLLSVLLDELFGCEVNELEFEVVFVLTCHLLHELISDLLLFLSVVILHLLERSLFEVAIRLLNLRNFTFIVIHHFKLVGEILDILWIELNDEEQGVVHEIEVVEKTDIKTNLPHDLRHVLRLELQTVLLFLQLEQVLVLKNSCVLEWGSEDFSLHETTFEVINLLDVLALTFFAVSHQNEVYWILIVHLD